MTVLTDIFLDVDGVLADCTQAPELLEAWPLGEYDLHAVLGHAQVWGAVADEGREFWAGLPRTPWFEETLALVEASGCRVHLATTPQFEASCWVGKVHWLREHVPDRHVVLTSEKSILAGPGRLLIDDCDANCEGFRAAGGAAIVFPALWNSQYAESVDPVAYVRDALDEQLRSTRHV